MGKNSKKPKSRTLKEFLDQVKKQGALASTFVKKEFKGFENYSMLERFSGKSFATANERRTRVQENIRMFDGQRRQAESDAAYKAELIAHKEEMIAEAKKVEADAQEAVKKAEEALRAATAERVKQEGFKRVLINEKASHKENADFYEAEKKKQLRILEQIDTVVVVDDNVSIGQIKDFADSQLVTIEDCAEKLKGFSFDRIYSTQDYESEVYYHPHTDEVSPEEMQKYIKLAGLALYLKYQSVIEGTGPVKVITNSKVLNDILEHHDFFA